MVTVTDFFLVGVMYYWGLTLNGIVMLNVILAVGTSVDYCTHIAYAYTVTPVPDDGEHVTKIKKREYKTKMALQTMGSSVFHGGFSTFIAIVVVSPS